MGDTLRAGVAPDDAGDLSAAISRIISEIDHRLTQMHRDQREIDDLKADSRALQAETLTILASLKTAA